MGSNAFGGSASQAPTTQPKEVPHYTFGPEDIEESYSAASPVNDSGWDSPGSYPPEPEAYESGVSRKKNKGKKRSSGRSLFKGFGSGIASGMDSLVSAVSDGISGQTPYEIPLNGGRGRNQWQIGIESFMGWCGGTVLGGFAGTIWILAFPDNRSSALSLSLTGLGWFFLAFSLLNFPLTRWVRQVPVLGTPFGEQRSFLFVVTALISLASMVTGVGPLWWMFDLVFSRIS